GTGRPLFAGRGRRRRGLGAAVPPRRLGLPGVAESRPGGRGADGGRPRPDVRTTRSPLTVPGDPGRMSASPQTALAPDGVAAMKIAVVGTGYVGLVTATCLAESGNDVIGIDKDARKIAVVDSGALPIYERGLLELVQRNREDERLRFATDLGPAVQAARLIFIAVGTPQSDSGEADLGGVWAVTDAIAKHLKGQPPGPA